jgi:clan AA aspartic protease
MGLIYADITLQNSVDVGMLNRGIISDEKVRQMDVKALVDTGAITLVINSKIARQLDLSVQDQVDIELADGTRGKGDLVGPVTIRFQNRMTFCPALVLPDANEVLLGAIPMEGMDVIIDPKLEQLTVHPDRPFHAGMKVK